MKKLTSLLLSSVLCLSLTMPNIAFAADDNNIELQLVDTNIDDSYQQEENEIVEDNNEAEQAGGEIVANNDEAEQDNDISEETEQTDDEVIENETDENDTDVILDDSDIEEDNNEINSEDDIPTVSITIDETGKLQDIVSDDGIMIEPVTKTENEVIADNQEDNISEEANTNEKEEEEEQESIEKAAPTQGVLYDYYGVYIKSRSDDTENAKYIREDVNGQNSNMQKYTYYSKETHYNHEIVVNVRTDGFGVQEQCSLSAGEFGFGQTHIEGVDPSNNAVILSSEDYVITNLDPEEKQVRFECSIQDPQNVMRRVTRIFVIKLKGTEASDDMPAAPTEPEFIVDNDEISLVLTGADSRMEYRKEETDTWIDCIDGDIAFEAPKEDTNYYVRYKAEGDTPASQTKKITAYARPASPIFNISASTEKFTQSSGFVFDTTYEMKIDDGDYFDVTEEIIEAGGTPFLDNVPAETQQILYIRKKATDTTPAGLERQIKLLPRAATPVLNYDKATFQLTGVETGMEYYNPTQSKWVSISKDFSLESFASSEEDVVIKVRVKQTTTNSASKPYILTIEKLDPAPEWEIDYQNELLTGLKSNVTYEWRKYGDKTAPWKTFQGPFVSLSELGHTSTSLNIYIRYPKTDTEPHSTASYVKIPSRPNGPTLSFTCIDPNYKDDIVIKDIDNTMEYSLDLGKTWHNVVGTEMATDFRSESYKIYFRYKATDTAFSSKNTVFTVKTRAAAPTNYINTITEILNSTSSLEYSYDNVNFTPCTKNMDMTTVIDSIPTGRTKNIYIRKMATETAPYSLTKTITMYARSNAPTTPKYDSVNQKINGVTTAMMYKSTTETSWHAIKGTSINVASYIKNDPNTTIQIRYKATSTSSASKSLSIRL